MTLAELRAQLDALYDRIATLEHVAASNKRHVQAIVPDLERAEATIARVRAHVEGVAGTTAAGASDYDIGSYELACAVLAALDGLDGPEPEDNGTTVISEALRQATCDAYQPPTTPEETGVCARCGMFDYRHRARVDEQPATITDTHLDALYDRLARTREAAALHRQRLIPTAQLYAVIEVSHALDGPGSQDTDTTPAELTAQEARDLVDELGTDLYQAQDALAFVGECCDIADREQRSITTADVREWLKGARCGRQLAADAAGPRKQPATITDPEWLRERVRAALPPYDKPILGDRSRGMQMGWDRARQAALDALDGEQAAPATTPTPKTEEQP